MPKISKLKRIKKQKILIKLIIWQIIIKATRYYNIKVLVA